MADVRVKSTGKELFRLDGGIIALLTEMFPGTLEKIEPKTAAPTKNHAHGPRWIVRPNPYSGAPQLILAKLNEEVAYPGPAMYKPSPEHAAEVFGAMGFTVPSDVLEQFRALIERAKVVAAQPELQQQARDRQAIQDAKDKEAAAILMANG